MEDAQGVLNREVRQGSQRCWREMAFLSDAMGSLVPGAWLWLLLGRWALGRTRAEAEIPARRSAKASAVMAQGLRKGHSSWWAGGGGT